METFQLMIIGYIILSLTYGFTTLVLAKDAIISEPVASKKCGDCRFICDKCKNNMYVINDSFWHCWLFASAYFSHARYSLGRKVLLMCKGDFPSIWLKQTDLNCSVYFFICLFIGAPLMIVNSLIYLLANFSDKPATLDETNTAS